MGVIMAVAGSAVGLGNFLRFPAQAAQNGGGAFMIPYIVALLLLGVPLCWVEWTMGRAAGGLGHGSGPGIFNVFWRHRVSRWFGALGLFVPVMIFFYYVYIEAWCLGYAWYALTGYVETAAREGAAKEFLRAFQGVAANKWFTGLGPAYFFFIITFTLNFTVIYFGVARGIETICKVALPVLIVMGAVIMIRVVTLGAPDPAHPDWNVYNGFGFFWNPDFSALWDAKVWLAAAGQIFFTTSVGLGVIITYASYLKPDDDVALSGLTAVSINEFVEVIIGGSIAIPAAFIFFGAAGAGEIGKSGSFNLGFVTMPLIFDKMPLPGLMGFLWFFLLFLAGITSSVSMLQPAIAFLEDEFRLNRHQSVGALGAVSFVMAQPMVFCLAHGMVDMVDFWAGTFAPALLAAGEAILFAWIYGAERGFADMARGADIKIPGFVKVVIKYITPLFLLAILGAWIYQNIFMILLAPDEKSYNSIALVQMFSGADRIYSMAAMAGMGLFFISLIVLVEIAFNKKEGTK
jgi:SNF family Na+-dependent transporter